MAATGVPGGVGMDADVGRLHAVAVGPLDRERDAGNGLPQVVDERQHDLTRQRCLAQDAPLGDVVHVGAVGADRDPVTADHVDQVVHPARWASGRDHELDTGLLDRTYGFDRPRRGSAAGAQQRPVEVGRNQCGSRLAQASATVAASCPHAPSISRPRVSRTVVGTPFASSRRTNSRSSSEPRCRPLGPRRRIERDQVDVHPAPVSIGPEYVGQHVGTPGLVVDVLDQRVLDRYPALGGAGVVPGCLDCLPHAPPGVDRYQLVA